MPRDLGIRCRSQDFSDFEGVNACTYFSYGADFWARLVQVRDNNHEYYFYVRAPSETEKQAAVARVKAKGPSTPKSSTRTRRSVRRHSRVSRPPLGDPGPIWEPRGLDHAHSVARHPDH